MESPALLRNCCCREARERYRSADVLRATRDVLLRRRRERVERAANLGRPRVLERFLTLDLLL